MAKRDTHFSRSIDSTPLRFVSAVPKTVVACIMFAAVPTVSRGDQIIVGRVSHSPVTIVRFEGGRLEYQTESGETKTVWLNDVRRLTVDRSGAFMDFNEAERDLSAGDPEQAIVRYRRTLRLSDSFWPELIAARLVQACALADRIDQAALHFVQVARGEHAGPPLAVRLIPHQLPTKRSAKAIRAIEHIESALKQAAAPEERIALTLFRFALLHAIGDKRSLQAARAAATLDISERLRCHRVFTIQLTALERSMIDTVEKEALAALDQAIRDCPKTMLPSFLLLRGESLMRVATTREDYIRAAWPLMRVVAHMPDDPLVPRALLRVAHAVEYIGRRDKAVELLEEGLAHVGLDSATRAVLQQSLDRLRLENNGAPTAVD